LLYLLGGREGENRSFTVSLRGNCSHALFDRLFHLETFGSLFDLPRPVVRGKEAEENDEAEENTTVGRERGRTVAAKPSAAVVDLHDADLRAV